MAGIVVVMPGPVPGLIAPAGVSAWTGRAEDPVLRHAHGLRRLRRRGCVIPDWITDLRGQLELSSVGSVIEGLAERFTVIRYDKPWCGPPDRGEDHVSFDGQVA